ncbi:MAG: hypothetical protein U0L91_11255 [Gemmiger sp.]|uniref:SRPBCC family protein n=1 Tax=Gemmiger sp. TaxID=2049027 RepID=UPI002E77745E|nr:SRPBCC family protein [Gemmiger sp.]MEE0801831.1 hypothetical protein [Gemmiger sp.]
MKSCVVTATYACSANKVWLYLTNPTLNSWRPDVTSAEIDPGGMKIVEKHQDGSTTEILFTNMEKPRRMTCNFVKGRVKGTFTAILFGSAESTSLECTLDVEGLGLFAKPQKQLQAFLETLRKALGE